MVITIEKFQAAVKIVEGTEEPTTSVLLVAALWGMTEEEARKLTIENFRTLRAQLPDMTPPEALVPSFEIGGVKYLVDTTFKTSGQMIDFAELHKNDIGNMHKILALFATPDGVEYTKDFEARAEIFRVHAEFRVAQSVAFFFSRLIATISESTKIYSQEKAAQAGTEPSGAGSRLSIIWRGMTGRNGRFTSHSHRVRSSHIWLKLRTGKSS